MEQGMLFIAYENHKQDKEVKKVEQMFINK